MTTTISKLAFSKTAFSKTILASIALFSTASAGIAIAAVDENKADETPNIFVDRSSFAAPTPAPNLPVNQELLLVASPRAGGQVAPQSARTQSVNEIYSLAGQFSALVSETRRAALSANLGSAASIALSVDRSPRLTRASTIDGAKAYAALAAARTPEFANNVKRLAETMGRENFIAHINAEKQALRAIPGFASAKSTASAALGSAYETISVSSAIIGQAAYDLQRERWSMVEQAKQPRLDAVAASWNGPISQISYSNDNVAATEPSARNEPINDKIMLAAALIAIDDTQGALNAIGRDSGKFCTNRAYLNLRQCLAATRYAYEHTFCLSRHAYSDFESCAKEATR